jgi:two-component system phosphate regulon sensor histidine kinase PhoR
MTMKNPTPRQLALYAALIIAGVNFLVLIITKLIIGNFPWISLIIAVSLVFVASYYVFAYALTRFIYRKIKVIYKAIHRLKRPKNDNGSSIDLRNHIIDEVEKEVLDWAKSQKKEIDNLKEMEAYRRNFLGNISHELKTPIFNIQGYLYTLLDGNIDDPELLEKYINRSVSNAERLNTIVQDLERIASLESGELSMDFQRFDIQSLTNEVFDDLEIKANERNLNLSFKEGSDRPYYVKGDREAIRQVITNLVSNSIKYGSDGGFTKAGFYDMENQVLIEMTDNGIGISEEHLPHLFERFYRVDKGRSRDKGGTGLGLSIVKHIIEAHDQTINVRSRADDGSTFGFTLEKG